MTGSAAAMREFVIQTPCTGSLPSTQLAARGTYKACLRAGSLYTQLCPGAARITAAWCGSAGARALELLLGAESGYVRDILAEELAKGLDAYWRLSADDALDAARVRLVAVLGVSEP